MTTEQTTPEMPPPPLPPAAPLPAQTNTRNPVIAGLLSLVLPGLGQIYNGQYAKALAFFFGFVGSLYMVVEGHVFPFVFLLAFIPLVGIIESARTANQLNVRALGGTLEEEEDLSESPYWGGALVLIGLVIFANNFGWLDLDKLARFWPLLLIGAGGAFIWSSLKKRNAQGDTNDTPSL